MTTARLSRFNVEDLRRRRATREARELASTLPVSIEPVTPVEQPIPSRGQPLEDANQGFFGSLADVLFTPLIPESAVDSLRNVPIVGRPLHLAGEVVQELSTPFDIGLTVATAGFGPAAVGAIKGTGAASKLARGLLAPVGGGSFASRAAAETALGAGAVVGAEVGERVLPDLPGPTESILGGLAGGGVALAGLAPAQRILNRSVQGTRKTIGLSTTDFTPVTEIAVTTPTYKFLQPMFTDSEINLRQDRLAALLTDGVDSPKTFSGPMYSTLSSVGGFQRAFDPMDSASVASLRHATRTQQSQRLATETSADFVVRFNGAFRVVDGQLPENAITGAPQVSQVIEDAYAAKRGLGGRESLEVLADGNLRNNDFGYVFTPEQADVIDDLHRLMGEGWDYATRNGVDIDKVALEGAGSEYFPRRVLQRMRSTANELRGSRSLGRKEAFQKTRTLIGQEIATGAANDVDYDGDIANLLNAYLNGIYRSVRDQQLHNDIAALAVKQVDDPAIPVARSILDKLDKTGKVTKREIDKVRAIDPDTARVIEEEIVLIDDLVKLDPKARTEAVNNLRRNLFGGTGRLSGNPAIGEGTIQSISGVDDPLFRGEIYDERTAKLINNQLQRTGNRFTELTGDVGDLLRTTQASADFSAPFIQGIFLAAVRPDLWGKGMKGMVEAWLRPEKYTELIADNLDVLSRHRDLNIASRNEFFAGIGPNSLLTKALRPLGKPGEIVLGGLARFDRAFTFYGDYARINLAKAFESIAEKESLRGNTRAFAELDSVINRMTGTFSPGELILSPGQEQLERAFLFFAPRYTRASLALATDVFKGGLRGDVARDAMVRAALGGMLAYVAIAEGLGQTPKLDPRPKFQGGDGGDFMAIKMPGSQDVVGIGSFWISFVRLTANVISDPALLGQGGVQDSSLLFQSTDPGGISVTDRVGDNQIFRWMRGRSATVSGTTWDLFNGHDFVGNPIEPGPDILKHIGQQTLPFALENVIMGSPARSGPAAFAGEIFGLRSHPMSRSARRNQLRDRLSQLQHGKNYDDLNRLQKERLETQNEELSTITEAARADRVVRGREIDGLVDEYFDRRDAMDRTWNDGVDLLVRTIQNDPARRGLPWMRDELSKLNSGRRLSKAALDKEQRFGPVRQWLNDLPNRPGISPEKPEDEAYSRYITDVLLAEGLDDPAGFDFEKLDQLRRNFREIEGDEIFGYVQARLDEGSGLNPLVQEFFDGRSRFEFFWGSPSNPASIVGAVINQRANPEQARLEYQRWLQSSELEQKRMEAESGSLSSLIKFIASVRLKARDQNAELDAFLFRWGFTTTLRHEENSFENAQSIARHPIHRSDYVLKQI